MFLNDLGYYVDISIVIEYLPIYCFDQMVGCIQMCLSVSYKTSYHFM